MRESRPRLLFLCQNVPYPPDGGALIRSFHTLRLLSRQFDVTALCFARAATRKNPEAIEASVRQLSDYAAVEAFTIPQEGNRLRFAWDHMRSVLTSRAYTRWTYESAPFRKRLQQPWDNARFDVAHVDSLDLVAYLPGLSTVPVVVAHHNVESQLLRRRAKTVEGIRASYIERQAELTRGEEEVWCPRATLNVVVSEEDEAVLRQIAPAGRYLVVPNGVDTTSLNRAHLEPRSGVVFVGGATWFPNRDGMEYFAKDILPLIQKPSRTLR